MPRCAYRKCRRFFRILNDRDKKKRFCMPKHRIAEWMLRNPRLSVERPKCPIHGLRFIKLCTTCQAVRLIEETKRKVKR